EPVVPLLAAALRVLGEPAPIVTFPATGDATAAARRILAEQAPSHLVSIERPGRTEGGDYLRARGETGRGKRRAIWSAWGGPGAPGAATPGAPAGRRCGRGTRRSTRSFSARPGA